MTATEADRLTRENDYLKTRCAQLQDDVSDLTSQIRRLEQHLERLDGRRTVRPDPLSGGQS